MTEEFDFYESSRRMEKNVTMVYYDQSHTYRNFILKLRELLVDYTVTPEQFRDRVELLNGQLLREEKQLFGKHY